MSLRTVYRLLETGNYRMTISRVYTNRLKKLGKIVLQINFGAVILFGSILLVRAYNARGLEDLQIWHRASLSSEFDKDQYTPDMTLEAYLQIEDRVFAELDKKSGGQGSGC